MRSPNAKPRLELAGLGCAASLAWVIVFVEGRTSLAPPSIGDPATWVGWYEKSGPVVGVFSLFRLVILGVLALWALGAFGLAAASLGRPGHRLAITTARILRFVRLPGSATMISLAVGLSVSAAALGACGATTGPSSTSPQTPLLMNPSHVAAHATAPLAPTSNNEVERLRQAGTTERTRTQAPSPTQATTPAKPTVASAQAATSARPAPASGLWVVRPGDDLWSIAADTLRLRLGMQPDRQEVATYWLAVIAANRATLPHPDDPSLLYAGDVVILPAADPAAAPAVTSAG